MLGALIKKQMLEALSLLTRGSKQGKSRSTGAIVGIGILFLFVFASIAFCFAMMALSICGPLVSAGLGWLYFALMGSLATLFGVIGSVFTTYNALYVAKDNELLLAMPIPPAYLLFSRMVGLYLVSLLFEAMVMLPACVVYWTLVLPSVAGVIFSVLTLLVLPLLALAISCLLGWLLALIAPHVKHKSIVVALISVAFFVLYYMVAFRLSDLMQSLIANSEALGEQFRTALFLFYQMGMGAEGSVLGFLLFVLITGGIFAIVYAVLAFNFVKLATNKRGGPKSVYREKRTKARSQGSALLSKELSRFWGSSVYLLNSGMGSLFLIVGAVAALVKAGWLSENIPTLLLQIGMTDMLPLLICAVVCMVASMNIVTAPSVSLEGSSIWILQSLPVDPWKVLRAKLELHVLITALPTVVCTAVLLAVLRVSLFDAVFAVLAVCLFVLFCAAFGLVMNLLFPNLKWNSEAVAVKQGMSTMIAMFGGWGLVLLLGGGWFLVGSFLTAAGYLLLCSLLLAAASALLLWRLRRWGSRRFAEL